MACLSCCWAFLVALAPAPSAEPLTTSSTEWRLTVDMGVVADSNITNSTDEGVIPIFQDGVALPVPLDPSLRARADVGLGIAASGGVDVALSDHAILAVDAEAFALDHEGHANDDLSLLVGVGPEFGWTEGEASLQLIAFERWYGGISANSGFGARARLQEQVASNGAKVILLVDARIFESGYGEPFGGANAAAYLSYQSVLDDGLTGSAGVFARREWLDDEAYSSLEIGAYGGLSRFLGPDFTGSLSGGLSRILFDAPVPFLSPDRREDWRFYTSLSLTTRRPLGWGLYPSLSYTYGRTRSTTGFFDADRHRVRAGLLRSF